MNGEVAQAIALVAYGNAFLSEKSDCEAPELLASNSTFQYVNSLEFVESVVSGPVSPIITKTSAWYRHLKRAGVTRFELKLSANGIGKAIQADSSHGQDFWIPTWETMPGLDRRHYPPHNRIWNVRYELGEQLLELVKELSVEAAMKGLLSAVGQAREFAKKTSQDHFVKYFDEALEASRAEEPRIRYYSDMIPRSGGTNERRQLMALAVGSWVFGGMGSWNDQNFVNQVTARKFHEITRRLYSVVLTALISATNTLQT